MPYNPNIPQANDQISVSQGQLLANFQSINTYLTVNHVPFPAADMGKHAFVEMPLQAAAPVSAANEQSFYNLIPTANPLTAIPELFLNKQSNAGVMQIPMASSILSTATPGNGAPGWTYLPSGIIIKWGIVAVIGNAGGGTAIYDATIPFTAFFAVTLGNGNSGGANYSSQISAVSTTQITIINRGTVAGTYVGANVYYCIIGR